MTKNVFTQNKVREILAKASEIQRSKNDLDSGERGITAAELQEIASEVGISKDVLKKAIQSVESRTKQEFNWLIGTGELQSSTIVDHEITDLQLDQLFPELNAYTGNKGNVEKTGNGYDWEQIENKLERVRRITVVPKDGKTKITQYVNWDEFRGIGLFLSALFGAVALALILKIIGIPKTTYLLLSPIGALVGYSSFMGGLKYYFNIQKKKFESIMQLIADVLERPVQHRISSDDEPQSLEENKTQNYKTRS